ncbi:MAG TPA: NAD(P)-binding domain-containing protein [Desulfosporosinus sp.]|nr:NAD(P)-binding domain-containing protein [Desulfosporosinus sp.]
MTNLQLKHRYEIGMIDLFFLGRILVLNMINLDFEAAAYKKNKPLRQEIAERNFSSVDNFLDCIKLLRKPNSIMMIVPASAPADSVIKDLSERFQLDDFSITEIQLCLTRFNTVKKSQISRLKLLLERK